MHFLIAFLAYGVVSVRSLPSSYHNCPPVFDPQNYLKHLPSLNLPYVNSVPIPINVPVIKATPVVPTTKIINVVTKYVTTNPVCIKVTSKKPLCKPNKNNNNLDYLITKEYFVKDRRDLELEASEMSRAFASNTRTPDLKDTKLKELLIEERLDHLEEILPHYTRRRNYETSTVTITKTMVDNRVKATLLVRNCVPEGYEFCPPKRRQSGVSEEVNNLSSDFIFNSNEF
ncbi:alpha/beta hydrolase domain-containing protein [Holotrichia oblita]|uniref:Alpha/beta hydrolase domain-containing protein n=1 Tax=Holotrichia oblita TaxID=644536 RepID=A0ACB9TUJ3_HOLOL|nr:alpha/beta hydrolase domain-containing protein [Holotrichia oblita]